MSRSPRNAKAPNALTQSRDVSTDGSGWQLRRLTPFVAQNYNHPTATRDSLLRAAFQRLASERFPRGSGRRGFQGVRDQPMKPILLRSLLPVAMLAVSALAQTANSAGSPAPAGASGGGSPAAPAAGAVSNRIGVIDIQSAILATNEGRREFEALQKKFEPKQNELTKLNQEIDELKKQLQAQGDKLNEEARGSMVKNIESKQKNLQRQAEDAQGEFQQQRDEIASRILQKLVPVLDKYAKANNYAVI